MSDIFFIAACTRVTACRFRRFSQEAGSGTGTSTGETERLVILSNGNCCIVTSFPGKKKRKNHLQAVSLGIGMPRKI